MGQFQSNVLQSVIPMHPLHVLILEDNELDFELTQVGLEQNLPEFRCTLKWVTNQEDFIKALSAFAPDIVLSDYNLPQYSGLQALVDTQAHDPFLPFLFVTGELQEEKVAETIRNGAWEYVSKDRLFRLPVAIRNALKIKEARLEKKKAELALEAREKRFRSLIEQSPLAIIEWGMDGHIVEWNPAAERLYGYSRDQVVAKRFCEIFSPEKDGEDSIQIWEDLLVHKGPNKHIAKGLDAAGKPILCEWYNNPLLDEEGEVFGIVSMVEDITERKYAEENLHRKNEELTKINEELDKFVYSASHDLRAPVTSMLGLIEVAKMEEDPRQVFEYLDKQKKTLKKMDEFIHEIVNYSRNGRLSVLKEEIDLKHLVEEIYGQYHYLEKASFIEKSVEVNLLVPFFSDRQRISMVLNNLISNSLKYADLDKTPPFLRVEVNISKKEVVIEVIDNGEGIRPDLVSKIFDMFYRATQNSSGSGLGLYIVKEVVQKLGGEIEVSSDLGQGTRFKVRVPNG